MILDVKLIDIKKWADEGDPSCQLLIFWALATGDMIKKDVSLAFEYLIKFVNHDPETCIQNAKLVSETFPELLDGEEHNFYQYSFYLTTIAIHLYEKGELGQSALWFKKSIDLVNGFLKYRDTDTRLRYMAQESAYQYWDDVEPYFDKDRYSNFLLEWEKSSYSPTTIANQNLKEISG